MSNHKSLFRYYEKPKKAHGHTSEKGDSFVKYYGQKMIPLNTFYGMTTFGEYAIPLFPSIP